jgi:TolB-like protein/DNA-binding winged helix-turn-helix (wHTH) protein
LLRDGTPVSITPKVFDTLVFLVTNAGRTVPREELIQAVWPDTFVEEGNLNYNMSQLRKILGEYAPGTPYIQTVPKRGYRFAVDPTQVNAISEPARLSSQVPRKRAVPWIAATVVLILVAGAGAFWRARLAKAGPHQIRSIAVLPLQNLSRDPDQAYFADGLTEVLTTSLAQISALNVIARNSAMHYQGTKKTTAEIARELHVDALVEGAVQRSGGRVLITTQLIDGSSDRHLWAKSFERDARDALALQNEVAQTIAGEIRAQLTPREKARLGTPRPINPEAQEAYLRGLYENHNGEVKKAIDYVERATQKDPSYAAAYALLANLYGGATWFGYVPLKEGNERWKAAVTRALELDDTLAEAHYALAGLLHLHDWNWSAAGREYQRSIELNPNLANTRFWHADWLAAQARMDEALAEVKHGLALDPFSFGNMFLVYDLVRARRFDEAIEQGRKILEVSNLPPGTSRRIRIVRCIWESELHTR